MSHGVQPAGHEGMLGGWLGPRWWVTDGRYNMGESLANEPFMDAQNRLPKEISSFQSWHKFLIKDTFMEGQTCNATPYTTGLWLDCVYTVSAMLFVLSLKGLSNQKTAFWGCLYGISGMSLAIIGAWLSSYVCNHGTWGMWVAMIPGAIIGSVMAMKVTMMEMPQMVGLLNAFGGLASAVEAFAMFVDEKSAERSYQEHEVITKDSENQPIKFDWGANGSEKRDWFHKDVVDWDKTSPAKDRMGAGHEYWHQVRRVENGEWARGVRYYSVTTVALHMALIIGSITFWGSLVACGKLMGKPKFLKKNFIPPARVFTQHILCFGGSILCCFLASEGGNIGLPKTMFGYGTNGGILFLVLGFVLSALWGVLFVMAIGGADMPVVICILNTGSGVAGVFAGFMMGNKLLVITGTFVASSGMILSAIMCVAMNRNLMAVLAGGFGEGSGGGQMKKVEGIITEVQTPEIAETFNNAKSIIIIPGYGMAAGKAQHKVAELVKLCRDRGIKVRFAIHPVAGRLPGHMNVLLAEARVPYEIVLSMDEINVDFPQTDVVLVLGANDIVNPAAEDDPNCPIAGMPVLQCWNAKNTFVVKRGKGAGYSGVDNPLFIRENNKMYYGQAADKMGELAKAIEALEPVGGNKKSEAVAIKMEEIVVEPDLTPLAEPGLKLGVIREDSEKWEKRVGITPAVAKMFHQKLNAQVIVQAGAGSGAGYQDAEYVAAGCIVLSARTQVISDADIIVCVTPPSEVVECSPSLKGKFVVAWIGKLLPDGKQIVAKAAAAGINLIDVTAVPRITIAQKLDVLSSQAKIAGNRAVIEGAILYGKFMAPEITAAGKYPPAKVMVLGAGVAGLAAIGTAVSLGAAVRAWDVRDVSDQVQSMGGEWITVDFKEDGAGAGGYAKESSEEFKAAQKATFAKHARECDIIITTAAIPGRASPVLIEDYMIRDMKPGSVVVDLAALGGGNCAATRKGETYVYDGKVTICGELDFPSKMARQASEMYANNMFNLIDHIKLADGKVNDILQNIDDVVNKRKEEVVTTQVVCSYNGGVINAPPPPMPSPPPKKEEGGAEKAAIKKASLVSNNVLLTSQSLAIFFALFMTLVAFLDNEILIQLMMVFMLAAWVGYMLVEGVHPALHTPLMSVSNAISGQVILGGIFMISSNNMITSVLAGLAIFIASMNVFGGFMVTYKMLKMFTN